MAKDEAPGGSADPAYLNAVDQILHAEWTGQKLGRLDLVRRWVGMLWPDGHPTKRVVQIAGTAGKGSVAAFLSAGLEGAGKVGMMTSPHLFDFAERIRIAGEPASQADIVAAWEDRVRPLAVEQTLQAPDWPVTFHDAILLVALCLFEKHGCDFAVMETGLGGRYDQVTALDAELAILTNVGDDHSGRLGDHLWQRALDKAGVARPGAPLVTGVRGEALDVAARVAAGVDAPLHAVGEAEVKKLRALLGVRMDALPDDALLAGEHQTGNAALAWTALEVMVPGFDAEAVLDRWATLSTPGRLSAVAEDVFIDTAHNVDEAEALANHLVRRFEGRRLVFVVGLSGSRSPSTVLRPIVGIADGVVVAAPPRYRGVPAETVEVAVRELARELRPQPIRIMRADGVGRALEIARGLKERAEDVVVFTGSAYMIDQELNPDPYLRELNASWGWRYDASRGR